MNAKENSGKRTPRKRITTGNDAIAGKRQSDGSERKPNFEKRSGYKDADKPFLPRSTEREGGEKRSFSKSPEHDYDRKPKESSDRNRPEGERKSTRFSESEKPFRPRSTEREGGEKRSFSKSPARDYDRKPKESSDRNRPESERKSTRFSESEKPFRPRSTEREGGEKRSFTKSPARDYDRKPKESNDRNRPESERKSTRFSESEKPFRPRSTEREGGEKRSFSKSPTRDYDRKPKESSDRNRPEGERKSTRFSESDKPFRPRSTEREGGEKRSFTKSPAHKSDSKDDYQRPFAKKTPSLDYERKPLKKSSGIEKSVESDEGGVKIPIIKEVIRLNKFLADAGVCSRREADTLIQAGTVTVNGVVVTELGTKVHINDKVTYGGQGLQREKLRYVLLNKPKGYITTSDDPYDRKTVMELVTSACTERIYPVGRLDRNTLGLLLLTNDGELAKRLMHPKHGVKKLYHVELDKPVTKNDILRIAEGLELEDGIAKVDSIAYVTDAESKKEVGIEIHQGKNRIVRRIFEHLGYKVVKLDRVVYAGLTKLNLTRSRYRHLTPNEISMLKRIK